MKEIIILGAGGHCKSIMDVIELEAKYKIAGIVDNELDAGDKVLGYDVIGRDKDLKKIKTNENRMYQLKRSFNFWYKKEFLIFQNVAYFGEAVFQNKADFFETTFQNVAYIRRATFRNEAFSC